MIRPGVQWGEATSGAPDVEVHGGDADLAAAVAAHPGALVKFVPRADSDVARAIGLTERSPGEWTVPMDVLRLADGRVAVNMAVVGPAPDTRGWHPRRPVTVETDGTTLWDAKAMCVVVATGEFLRGLDVVPRGHPGDGRAEVQVYDLRGRQRREMQRRLPAGAHVPHPGIVQRSARTVRLRTALGRLELDGRVVDAPAELTVEVVPNAYRLLV